MPSRNGKQSTFRFLTERLVLVRITGGIRTVQRAKKRLGLDYVQALDGVLVPRWLLPDYEAGRVKALSEFVWNAKEHGRCRAVQEAQAS